MPSPLLHSAAGAALAQAGFSRTRQRVALLVLVVAANAPDLDLIPGLLTGDAARYHHGIAHSLGAAVLAGGAAAAAAAWWRLPGPIRWGLLVTGAVASHLVFDMLSTGKGVHNAMPVFWPLSDQGFVLPPSLFPDIEYDPAAANFFGSLLSWPNTLAVLVESAVIVAAYVTGALCRVVCSRWRHRPTNVVRPEANWPAGRID